MGHVVCVCVCVFCKLASTDYIKLSESHHHCLSLLFHPTAEGCSQQGDLNMAFGMVLETERRPNHITPYAYSDYLASKSSPPPNSAACQLSRS